MDKDKITHQGLHQFLILKILIGLDGKARREKVLEIIEKDYHNILTEKDLEDCKSGYAQRWRNHVSWARLYLKDVGCLRHDSPYGIWEITDEGRGMYKELLEIVKRNLSQTKRTV